jgi:hypothetical protein
MLHKMFVAGPLMPLLWLISFYLLLVGTKVTLAVLVGRWRLILRGKAYIWINRVLGLILLFFAAILAWDGFGLLTTAPVPA